MKPLIGVLFYSAMIGLHYLIAGHLPSLLIVVFYALMAILAGMKS